MVWPESVPILLQKDFHVGLIDFEESENRSLVGWLQTLFLYSLDGGDVVITHQDNLDYQKAMDILRREVKCNKYDFWDVVNHLSKKRQREIYNIIIKELGYTEVK